MPPKAKELDMAVRIVASRATLGTASTGQRSSSSRKLIVGGIILSRIALIVIASSRPPLAPSA